MVSGVLKQVVVFSTGIFYIEVTTISSEARNLVFLSSSPQLVVIPNEVRNLVLSLGTERKN